MSQIAVNLGKRSYNIYVEEKLLANSSGIEDYCIGNKVLILTNETIAPIYFEYLANCFKNKTLYQFILPDGEIHKNLTSYSKVLDFLIQQGFRRNDTLIALGGGVIGDLGGFVAASYQRGMGFVQVPTTLLAQVDSSVGGKTAVNHPAGKNMIGAFYQPKAVFIDTDTLDTLPEREFISGLAEVAKYAILGESEIKKILLEDTALVNKRDKRVLARLIQLSCAKKAQVVSADEEERGSRALLNLGHTFGHAIEKMTDYSHYLHGEAVSIGIQMAINLSLDKKLISSDIAQQYKNMLIILGLPDSTSAPVTAEGILSAMKLDKKNISEKYRLILPCDKQCVIVEESNRALLTEAILKQIN